MASSDQVDLLHRDVVIFMGTGTIAALLGMSSYFMTYEYEDLDRLNVNSQSHLETTYKSRKKVAFAIIIIALIFYVSGIILLALGISLYRNERTEIASSITGIIQQTRNAASQPSVNEPAILAGIAAAMILGGMFASARSFRKTEQFGWIGMSIYTAGWILNAFPASMNDNSVGSLDGSRLAWALPGAVAICAGTYLLPWVIHHNYVTSPAFVIMSLGYVAFGVSTSFVLEAPN